MFKEVKTADFVALEQEVIAFWREREVFRKSVEKEAPKGDYVFYEGPPTANGKPGVHHVISRCYKDLFPRFKTMQGFRVGRKGGWDTHGLPVEIAIEKRLGFTRKSQIEDFGIERFNALCRAYVFENIADWNAMTERIGYWLDLENAYVTYDNAYIASCWWVLKSLWDRGLLVEDYRTTWHCPRSNTSLSSHEVSQGYKEDVEDPSVYPKFAAARDALVARGLLSADETRPVSLMAWTTTPWTLAANTGLAVQGGATYALVAGPARYGEGGRTELYVLAHNRLEAVFGEGGYELLRTFPGEALVGVRYAPLFEARVPPDEDPTTGWRVVADESVTLEDGTGVLHVAPAYGDLELGRRHGLPTLFSVGLTGEVFPEVKAPGAAEGDGPYTGLFFKDADGPIADDLLAAGKLFRRETIRHTYPFNWRNMDVPLINYAKRSWYLRTTALKDKLLANNDKINWVPDSIRTGRFGKWLENNVDWALSRERYWGAPLPIWEAEDGERVCVGSVAELEALTGRDLSGLELHRPFIDEVTFERDGKTFRRVPYTVDVWFESGAMPYAQWGYLGERSGEAARETLRRHFPADYICEAVDQTRGWFYSLHALATLLTDGGDGVREPGALAWLGPDMPAFKNVIVLGHILDENGEKMSKSKGNIVDPWTVLDAVGADALRWYLYASSPPEASKRFSLALVEETQRDLFNTLWNTYSFFVLYANLDRPELTRALPVAERPELDRWLVAKVHALVRDVTAHLEAYDPTSAARAVRDFVVDDLSNWYVRRSRRRFWKSSGDADKRAAYATLYEALVTTAKLMAPMAPFVSEAIYQNLVLALDPGAPESVHLAAWPTFDPALIDEALLRDMNALRRIVELGRAARAASKVKTRQPLPEVLVRVRSADELAGVRRLEPQLLDELNVKRASYLDPTADFVDYEVKPNLPLVGKRFGKLIPALKRAIAERGGREIAQNVREGRETVFVLEGREYRLEPEAFLLDAKSPEGYAALEERGYLAALNTQLTPELIQEGLVRDAIRLVQNARKNAGFEVADRIELGVSATGALREALEAHLSTLQTEVLAHTVSFTGLPEAEHREEVEVEGTRLGLELRRAPVAQGVEA
ncbi:isoleucine--tRNA ligase [Truepera radiovictrix]|uniref:Isoleucine--tRNA ligase n=1 Tax=Truepera radiovictrix (strain DSM 17093 / CIP 108686 / LMG 22925 / RQ-24) TaxID=649638 RepID=D7CSK6_TRURR|nr:isoleucine--tRNA ligase [Truepera radiovictrix]ADI15426.1 isoleucyl-tRNA synthetase [Truepera radiovictrix DSM 17093]WMT56024.1 isoleucine--tRNA ligase [Truepera radiovictrix]